MTERGTLILVVGPSGAGKDSLIAGAAARLSGDARIIFAQRVITRPVCDGGERHTEISRASFAKLRGAGGFMLHWQAHGFDYGVPQALAADLDAGRSVVANVSRTIVAEARGRFPPVAAVAISASPEMIAARLKTRGRESDSEIDSRMLRATAIPTYQVNVTVENDGPLDAAIDRFVAVLHAIIGQPAIIAAQT